MLNGHRITGLLVVACVASIAACEEKPVASATPVASTTAPQPSAAPASSSTTAGGEPAAPPAAVKNVPKEGTLEVDRAGSKLGWTDDKVKEEDGAEFKKYEATLEIKDGKPVAFTVSIKAPSLSVKDKPELERHAKSESLDAVNNANVKFESSSLAVSKAPNDYEVEGKITFRLTPKPASFPITVETRGTDFRVKGRIPIHGANHGAKGELGVILDLVFPFPS